MIRRDAGGLGMPPIDQNHVPHALEDAALNESTSPNGRAGRRRGGLWLAGAMLAATLGIVLWDSSAMSQFHRGPTHDFQTSKVLAIAANLSAGHGYRLFIRSYPGPDGGHQYELYGRYPVTAYALISIAINLAGDDLRGAVLAARVLMLTLLFAAALLLFHALASLRGNRLIAGGATLLAFSSQYMCYWGDAVGIEMSLAVFGIALGFHGIAVFTQTQRLCQLLAKIGVALLGCWPVMGLVLAFVALGVGADVARVLRRPRTPGRRGRRNRALAAAASLVRSRYMLVGLFAFLWTLALVAFNSLNEHSALGADASITQLPEISALLRALHLAEDPTYDYSAKSLDALRPAVFAQTQLHRVGAAALPGVVSTVLVSVDATTPHPLLVAVGAGVLATCVLGLRRLRRAPRTRPLVPPLVALAAGSFCYALPLYRNTGLFAHEYQGMHLVGVAAVFHVLCALALPRVFRWARSGAAARLFAALGGAACVASFAQALATPRASAFQDKVFADFQIIRQLTRDATVFVVGTGARRRYLGARHAMDFYLNGRVWQYSDRAEESYRQVALGEEGSVWHAPPYDGAGRPDFVIARDRFEIPALRTPDNAFAFAYDSLPQLADAYRSLPILAGPPVARTKFNVHLARNRTAAASSAQAPARWRSDRGAHELAYAKEPCSAADVKERFFLHVAPTATSDLPPDAQPAGFENLDFAFDQHGVRLAGMCLATLRLPAYPIDRIATGQLAADGERAWQVEFAVDGVDRP